MKIIALTLAVIFFSGASVIPARAQASQVAVVPIQFRGQFPVVEAKINGKGPFIFLIDTGSGPEADLDTALVAQLGLKPNGNVRGGDPSGRNVQVFDTVAVDSISLGGVEFRNVTALSRQQRISPNAPKVDGILGFPLFRDYLLTLDYPGKQVRLARGELAVANGKDILTFDSPHRIPVIDLAVGQQTMRAHIDSGNMVGGFILPTSLVEKLTFAGAPVTVARARTVNNEIEIKEVKLNDTVSFGSFQFSQPTITFPAIAAEANIGFRILHDFTLTFDQKNKRVKFERQTSKAPDAIASSSSADARVYLGKYGERTILLEGDALYLQRNGGPKIKLVATTSDEFNLERVPAARLKFVRGADGKVIELHVLTMAGEWEVVKRDQ